MRFPGLEPMYPFSRGSSATGSNEERPRGSPAACLGQLVAKVGVGASMGVGMAELEQLAQLEQLAELVA